MRRFLLTFVFSMLLGALSVVVLVCLCLALRLLGAGMLGFWIFSWPGSALSPFFSFMTSLLPSSLVHALVGTSSVGSSFGLLALWSLVFWFVLFWVIAFVILRRRIARRSLMDPSNHSGGI